MARRTSVRCDECEGGVRRIMELQREKSAYVKRHIANSKRKYLAETSLSFDQLPVIVHVSATQRPFSWMRQSPNKALVFHLSHLHLFGTPKSNNKLQG